MAIAPDKLRARVAKAIEKSGTGETSKALGISPEALARLVGGLDVRNGTIAQVEKTLPAVEQAGGRG
jgi:hypothetical protein